MLRAWEGYRENVSEGLREKDTGSIGKRTSRLSHLAGRKPKGQANRETEGQAD